MGIELENGLKIHFLQKRGRQRPEHFEDSEKWTEKAKGKGNFVHTMEAIYEEDEFQQGDTSSSIVLA